MILNIFNSYDIICWFAFVEVDGYRNRGRCFGLCNFQAILGRRIMIQKGKHTIFSIFIVYPSSFHGSTGSTGSSLFIHVFYFLRWWITRILPKDAAGFHGDSPTTVFFFQVDTRGKGYAPAIQTVPFRDASCVGFGALFIYNTDTQAGAGLGGLVGWHLKRWIWAIEKSNQNLNRWHAFSSNRRHPAPKLSLVTAAGHLLVQLFENKAKWSRSFHLFRAALGVSILGHGRRFFWGATGNPLDQSMSV